MTTFPFSKPNYDLPVDQRIFGTEQQYVSSLLNFATTSHLFQTLTGKIHILDFFTRDPGLYEINIPHDWRTYFEKKDLNEILDLLLREDINTSHISNISLVKNAGNSVPVSLLHYIIEVRNHSLNTEFRPLELPVYPKKKKKVPHVYSPGIKELLAGSNIKKVHEVTNFSRYVAGLADSISNGSQHDHDSDSKQKISNEKQVISHLVDFGCGANYLGRILASPPYEKHVIGIESQAHVVELAEKLDVRANLRDKKGPPRNKKLFLASGGVKGIDEIVQRDGEAHLPTTIRPDGGGVEIVKLSDENTKGSGSVRYVTQMIGDGEIDQVIAKVINDNKKFGDNADANTDADADANIDATSEQNLMVISLHSCGNLVHHGLRTLILNQSVRAVAMIGCCYNLTTERLTSQSFKIPSLRAIPSISQFSINPDPHGYPMSDRFMNFSLRSDENKDQQENFESGIHLNITARMLAVQAPKNWTREASDAFFTRHFYRALLQKIFLDAGIVTGPTSEDFGRSPAGTGSQPIIGTRPIVIGSLPKSAYSSFIAYVRAAVVKLQRTAERSQDTSTDQKTSAANTPNSLAPIVSKKLEALSDEDIAAYEIQFAQRRKDISIMWSLMAFSAQVVESLMVVDRWCWLKEQSEVEEAWVEAVFDYGISPRNMVIVGLKKKL